MPQLQDHFDYQPPQIQPVPYNHANMMAQMAQQQTQNQGFQAPLQQPPQYASQTQQKGFSNCGRGRGRGGRGGRVNFGGRGGGCSGGHGGQTFPPQIQYNP